MQPVSSLHKWLYKHIGLRQSLIAAKIGKVEAEGEERFSNYITISEIQLLFGIFLINTINYT